MVMSVVMVFVHPGDASIHRRDCLDVVVSGLQLMGERVTHAPYAREGPDDGERNGTKPGGHVSLTPFKEDLIGLTS